LKKECIFEDLFVSQTTWLICANDCSLAYIVQFSESKTILLRIESSISKCSEHSIENKNSLYTQMETSTPTNCLLLTHSYRNKRNFGDLCFISWQIGSMYFVKFSEITTSKCYFTEKAASQNAMSTTGSKIKKWKKMHHNNYYLKLIGKKNINQIFKSNFNTSIFNTIT